MKTTHAIAAAGFALALALPLFPAGKADADKPGTPAERRAVVAYMEGSVRVDGKDAELGQSLGALALIETGEASVCEVVFADKNVMRFTPGTKVAIDFSKPVVGLDLKSGGVASVLRKLNKVAGTDAFTIRTKNASAGVRGTSFCVWAREDFTYVCACNGEVRTLDGAGANEVDLSAAHHAARIYTKTGDGWKVEAAGLVNHDDASLEALAARIGETIDWTKLDR